MSFWSAVVVIVLILAIARVLYPGSNARPGHSADRGDDLRRLRNAEDEALRAEIAELKDRIQVLERIVTDNRNSIELADEIEKLRGHRHEI
jgi:hypothetical protein